MNPYLSQLHPYPFEKLARLKAGITPPAELTHIPLSIGEPKHQPPQFVLDTLANNVDKVANYAPTKGQAELRQAMANWAIKRFDLNTLDIDSQILPVNGTREALFAFTQAVIDGQNANAKVLMPNPFYQIYEGAAILANAEPVFLNCNEENGFIPDFDAVDAQTWQDCQLLFLCSPGNPTGAVLDIEQLQKIIALADKYNFIIASDECYSELYFDEAKPPAGLLQACAAMGRHDYDKCVVFHSLSKRSNLPGLRSGFIAGDSKCVQPFLLYRTYHGCAMPIHTQLASIAAWQDEAHVQANRAAYREKFSHVCAILADSLAPTMPDAGFYLWLNTPIDDEAFARALFEQQHITVLPGSYLARDTETSSKRNDNSGNPGKNRVRMALVAPLAECIEGAERIRRFVSQLAEDKK